MMKVVIVFEDGLFAVYSDGRLLLQSYAAVPPESFASIFPDSPELTEPYAEMWRRIRLIEDWPNDN